MSNYIMRAEDEFPHQPDADSNFNESVYTNAFNMASPPGRLDAPRQSRQ